MWGTWGSYYDIIRSILYLLKGDFTCLKDIMPPMLSMTFLTHQSPSKLGVSTCRNMVPDMPEDATAKPATLEANYAEGFGRVLR